MGLSARLHIRELACFCACVGFKSSWEHHIVGVGLTLLSERLVLLERGESILSVVVWRRQSVTKGNWWKGDKGWCSSRSVCLWKAKTCFLNLLQNRFLYRLKLNHPWRATPMFLGYNSSNRSCLGLAGFYWWKCLISAPFLATPSLGCVAVKGRHFILVHTAQYTAVCNSCDQLMIARRHRGHACCWCVNIGISINQEFEFPDFIKSLAFG